MIERPWWRIRSLQEAEAPQDEEQFLKLQLLNEQPQTCVHEMTERPRGGKKLVRRPKYNCRPFLSLAVPDGHVVNKTTNECHCALYWLSARRNRRRWRKKKTVNLPFAVVISLM